MRSVFITMLLVFLIAVVGGALARDEELPVEESPPPISDDAAEPAL